MTKVKLNYYFVEWFKETNEHLYKKGVTKQEIAKELEEYVNDVLEEHMEAMGRYDVPPSDKK
tara:strand:- start:573 stop:758 length:186 start_codon:yes stop_codon:yes gene_type:complete